MKKVTSFVIAILFLLSMSTTLVEVSAKSKNKNAYESYSEAVNYASNDFYGNTVYWYLDDINGDKVKDLFLTDGELFRIYTYKNKSAVVLAEKYPDRSIHYQKADKIFWEVGEGDGGWAIKYKVTKSGFKEIVSYHAHMYSNPKYWKEKNGKKTKISSKKYMKIYESAFSGGVKYKSSTFSELSGQLKKMSR